jgi:hypothetical protein
MSHTFKYTEEAIQARPATNLFILPLNYPILPPLQAILAPYGASPPH